MLHNNHNLCRECQSGTLTLDSKESTLFCKTCGFENINYRLDYSPEWRGPSKGVDNALHQARAGGPVKTTISSETNLSTSLCKADASVAIFTRISETEKNMCRAYGDIESICDRLCLTAVRVKERAYGILRKLAESNMHKIARLRTIQAASVLYATRLEGGNSNRTLKEFALATARPQKEIAKCYQKIDEKLKYTTKLCEHPIVSYSKNYAVYLNLPPDWVTLAGKVAERTYSTQQKETAETLNERKIICFDKTWDGRSKTSIAATIIFIITRLPRCPEKVDLCSISLRSGVQASTIMTCYREMLPVIHKLLDNTPTKFATLKEIINTFSSDIACLTSY